MAAHSSILAWKFPWTEKPGGLLCHGVARVGHDLATHKTKKMIIASPFTIFVPHALEALLSSYHTQRFSVSDLTFSEVFLLTASHITLIHCKIFNPTILLSSITSEVLCD